MTVECVEKILKKDMIHPLTGEKLKDSDIIIMKRVSFLIFVTISINQNIAAPKSEKMSTFRILWGTPVCQIVWGGVRNFQNLIVWGGK